MMQNFVLKQQHHLCYAPAVLQARTMAKTPVLLTKMVELEGSEAGEGVEQVMQAKPGNSPDALLAEQLLFPVLAHVVRGTAGSKRGALGSDPLHPVLPLAVSSLLGK